MEIIIVHFLLGIGLFFIINWIGKHSYSIGYMEISIFVKTEEAPALNFLIRVLTPIVYLIIISTVLYYFGFDRFVANIFLVNIYYILFRLFFNLLTNRVLLLNWYRQFIYWVAIAIISYFTYEKIIKVKTNILPDFTTVSNELWIIILIFIFQVTNNIRLSKDATQRRKQNYLKSRFYFFNNLYGSLVKEITKNEILEALTYSIMIYEDFNRPKIARLVENTKFRLTKKQHSLGIMQVTSDRLITDEESVVMGTNKIVKAHNKYLEKTSLQEYNYYEWGIIRDIIADYNGGQSYADEVLRLFSIIKETFYKDSLDTLNPKNKNIS